MTLPVSSYTFDPVESQGFPELTNVRLLRAVKTDDGEDVPEGTEGTVVGVWSDNAAYEVEFEVGLATVAASHLVGATGRR